MGREWLIPSLQAKAQLNTGESCCGAGNGGTAMNRPADMGIGPQGSFRSRPIHSSYWGEHNRLSTIVQAREKPWAIWGAVRDVILCYYSLISLNNWPITDNTELSSLSIGLLVDYVFNSDKTLRLVFSLPNQNSNTHLHSNLPLPLFGAEEAFLVLGRQ